MDRDARRSEMGIDSVRDERKESVSYCKHCLNIERNNAMGVKDGHPDGGLAHRWGRDVQRKFCFDRRRKGV